MFRVWSLITRRFALLPLATTFLLADGFQRRPWCTPMPKTSEVIRGEYQNKIRRYSPHEKIFEVFATHYEKGQLYMDCHDLMKSICFYGYYSKMPPPTDFKPSKIIAFVGGQDDRISVYDYFNFVSFMEIDDSELTNTNADTRKLSEEDIYNLLKKAHEKTNAILKENLLLESRRVKIDMHGLENSIRACAKWLISTENVKNLRDLVSIRRQFLKEIYRYEFHTMPRDESNTIDSQDFAKSIVKYIDQNKIAKFILRAQNTPVTARITCEQYIGFHLSLESKMESLRKLCDKKGVVTAAEIHETLLQSMKQRAERYNLQPDQSLVMLKLLDEDSSGFVEKRQLSTLIHNLRYYSTSLGTPESALDKIAKDWQVWKQKFSRIREIMKE